MWNTAEKRATVIHGPRFETFHLENLQWNVVLLNDEDFADITGSEFALGRGTESYNPGRRL